MAHCTGNFPVLRCLIHAQPVCLWLRCSHLKCFSFIFVFPQRSHKKIKDDEKEKEKKDKPEKGHCFWESVTMTMRQISPAKKLEKMEGWEPPHLENLNETVTDEPVVEKNQRGDLAVSLPDSLSVPLELASWGGRGLEEDSSRYANLSDSKDSTAAVRWTARAKVKLAGISRMSRGIYFNPEK
uniref:Uncharacterized protein n=1 Tax=Acanthochromis polyacanthus TaxID=80966 RepID=A0A3Q1G0J2_9TELE